MVEFQSPASVGIVTRTKDRSDLLGRCLESVKQQTFSDWQHVIVNDGGDQAAVESCVRKHHGAAMERVGILHHETSRGMEAASNSGIRALNSEFVVLLDDDDTWHETFLEVCIGALRAARSETLQGVVVHSKVVLETLEGGQLRKTGERILNPDLRRIDLWRLAHGNLFAVNAFLYARSALEKTGYYDESLPVLGDWEFNCRFFAEFDAVVVPEPLANYHQRPAILNSTADNTVTAGLPLHEETREIIRNRWIREDLKTGRFGLGAYTKLDEQLRDFELRMKTLIKRRHNRMMRALYLTQAPIVFLLAVLLLLQFL